MTERRSPRKRRRLRAPRLPKDQPTKLARLAVDDVGNRFVEEQIISCPNCEGYGWVRVGNNRYYECAVCDKRGRLIVDHTKTQALSPKRIPIGGKRFEQ